MQWGAMVARTTVVFFRDSDGSVPVKAWLENEVARTDRRAAAKLRARLNMLRTDGRDLRRPIADYLRDGIYEVRAQFGSVNYRLLYFFFGDAVAVVSSGLTKEAKMPDREIDLAVRRKALFESDPERHTYEEA